MKIIKYLIQFIIICVFYVIFKIIGVKLSSFLSGKLFEIIGPIFRSKKIVNNNIKKAFPDYNSKELNKIKSSMWNNYGRVFAEYLYMKNFRDGNLSKNISLEGEDVLLNIRDQNLYKKVNDLFETSIIQLDNDLKDGTIDEDVYEQRLQKLSNDRNTLLKIHSYFITEAKYSESGTSSLLYRQLRALLLSLPLPS